MAAQTEFGGTKGHLTTAQRIRIARNEAGLTQTELSNLSGVAQANISNYERGKDNPNAATVDKLMQAVTAHMGQAPTSLGAVDGLIGVTARTDGKLLLADPMAKPRDINWIMPGFLAKRVTTIIAGEAGAGKSSVTQTIMVALAENRSQAAGMGIVNKPGGYRVLAIDAENACPTYEEEQPLDASLVQTRLQEYGLTRANNYRITIAGTDGFDIEKDMKALDAALSDLTRNDEKPDVLVLDSFTSLYFGSVNSDSVRYVLVELNRLAVRHDLAILLIHHTDKSGEAIRGNALISATVGIVTLFTYATDDKFDPSRLITWDKIRIAAMPRPVFNFVARVGVLSNDEFGEFISNNPDEFKPDHDA